MALERGSERRKRKQAATTTVTRTITTRDGLTIEKHTISLGEHHPRREPVDVKIDKDRVESWLERGAQLSPTVKNLLKRSIARRSGEPSASRRGTATTAEREALVALHAFLEAARDYNEWLNLELDEVEVTLDSQRKRLTRVAHLVRKVGE